MSKPVGDLKGLNLVELREILQRQKVLLSNRSFINKLLDKGEKIKQYYDKVKKEIEKKEDIDNTTNLLMNLNIAKANVESIEWKCEQDKNYYSEDCLDSDDDSEPEDPLSIIARSTANRKIIKIEKEANLITEKDIKEISKFKQSNISNLNEKFDSHTLYICDKSDKSKLKTKESFKPYKTLIHQPKKKPIKPSKNWELTAATPGPSLLGPVKELSIQEALELHEHQMKQLKEVQMKRAAEKLAELKQPLKATEKSPPLLLSDSNYRNPVQIESESEESDHETSDQEVYDEQPHEGGVVFTVYK